MLDFQLCKNDKTGEVYLETSIRSKPLLTTPQLNKGTAFNQRERHDFGLLGKLPPRIETLEEQVERAYLQYQSSGDKLNQNIYLNNLHNTNQTVFYALVNKYLMEMVPTIYTPIVGQAVKQFSKTYRKARGLYIAYPEQDHIEEILDNRSNPEVDIIVVTDGEAILGIGDQGVGGIDIPIAKLMVYTLIAGINHNRVLPIQLDVGTNNQELLDEPQYLGWNHKRIKGKDYDQFIEKFVSAIKKKFPHVFLHWEDFGRDNACKILKTYQNELCTFNDDIQGTGAVTLAAILAALKQSDQSLREQRICVYGAGSAGMGIVEQLYDYMIHHGIDQQTARDCFWLIDRPGLLFADQEGLTQEQQKFSRAVTEKQQFNHDSEVSLAQVIDKIKPSILIGCSARTGAFTEDIIKKMAKNNQHPIILPLSNPTEQAEATPENIIKWTNGNAYIATGSPFEAVEYQETPRAIAQCNNALVFPALGLGIVASKASRCTPKMVQAAAEALAEFAPINSNPKAPLLPNLEGAREIAPQIAYAVAKQAIADNVSGITDSNNLKEIIQGHIWKPKYVPYHYNKNAIND
jgi:malate dehydrogenase (oxaloacetate-decarboxylating)